MNSNSKYAQIYEDIKADIYNNYESGSFLPPEDALMKKYGASRTTIRHAIQLLKDDGIIEVKQGLGTRVLLSSEIDRDGFMLFHNVTDVTHYFPGVKDGDDWSTSVHGGIIDVIPASAKVANALDIPCGSFVYSLERLITLNCDPLILCRNYFRYDLFPGLKEYTGKIEYIYNMYRFFAWKYNIHFSKGEQLISTQLASFFDAKVLNIEPSTPLLLMRRTSHTGDTAFEYTEWLANPNLLNIRVKMEGSREFPDMPSMRPGSSPAK